MEDEAAAQSKMQRWKTWAQESVQNGGGAAHRYSRREPMPQVDPWDRSEALAGQSAVQFAAQPWHALWHNIRDLTADEEMQWAHTL
eukprot:1845665-Amphidinium_carterae.1